MVKVNKPVWTGSRISPEEAMRAAVAGRFDLPPMAERPEPDAPEIDPKQSAGAAKIPVFAFPPGVLMEASAAVGEGMVKYGPHNWATSGGVCMSTYISGCFRHLLAFAMGEDIDPDTVAEDGSGGISHLSKLIASAAVLRDAQLRGVAADDRPPAYPPETIAELTKVWQGLVPRAEAARAKLQEKD